MAIKASTSSAGPDSGTARRPSASAMRLPQMRRAAANRKRLSVSASAASSPGPSASRLRRICQAGASAGKAPMPVVGVRPGFSSSSRLHTAIASRAGANLRVEKRREGSGTLVEIALLGRSGRVDELVRLLGASGDSGNAAKVAREMLAAAEKERPGVVS